MSAPMMTARARRSIVQANEARPPAFSDDALAENFAEQYGEDFLYIAKVSAWRKWDGKRWAQEQTLMSFDLARRICRQAAAECNEERLKKAIASANTVANIERLARSDRRHAATVDQFDTDPWLINSPSGVIDLRSGEICPHRRDYFMTKITTVGPGGCCPRWKEFLRRVTDGDEELERYIQRVVGYALTGSVREHALFFCYGPGGNGKSVFSETVRSIIGDYAMPAPMEMFTATKFQAHTTDVAGLQGARFVTASETEQGRFFAEARIKLLTGGDKVSARRMRTDNFEFSPQFKLFLSGNKRPLLRSTSEAMRRRMHVIPFDVVIEDHEKDPRLLERLREEWSGILQWAIDGCSDWQRRGLAPPGRAIAATTAYLEAQDTLGDWIDAALERWPDAKSTTDQLSRRHSAGDAAVRFYDRERGRGLQLFRSATRKHSHGPALARECIHAVGRAPRYRGAAAVRRDRSLRTAWA